jgi:hypothetical protein
MIAGLAQVFGDAIVSGKVFIFENAQIYGSARYTGNTIVGGEEHRYGSAKKLGQEDIDKDPALSFHSLFVTELENVSFRRTSKTEFERIANLILLGVIKEAFWGCLLKANNEAITRAIAYRTVPNTAYQDPTPVFISKLNDFQLRILTSQDPSYAMEYFSKDHRVGVRCFVARHLETPTEVLAQLALDPVLCVRHAVSKNPNTPFTILDALIEDFSLIENSNNPNDELVASDTAILGGCPIIQPIMIE